MFERNLAFIIGINNYTNGISPLKTAVNDAKKLVEILRQKHDYKVWVCLDEIATLTNLNKLLDKTLPEQVSEHDRLLFYFAGHGVALNGDDGPAGYLIPQDAKQGDTNSYLAMTKLHDALSQLPCRHFLGILDCCFAGAFRWSTTRDLLTLPEVIHKERYDRFIADAAWQIITSSASDQKALDNFYLDGERGQIGNHSPFAAALFEALEGAADIYPLPKPGKPAGDGVITATELYLYLRDRVEVPTEKYRLRQTPGIWCLNKHDKGEYIFLSPEHELNLPPAPPLDELQNPYRGLQSFEEEHSKLFFGRQALTEQLYKKVCKQPLTVVLGASGTGKSSLVKAGLIPYIKKLNLDNVETFHGTFPHGRSLQQKWHVLPPMRPGESPLKALKSTLDIALNTDNLLINTEEKLEDISIKIGIWLQQNPQFKLLLVIDQTEELLTICRNEQEREDFLVLLGDLVTNYLDKLRIILTLRSDFEPQFQDTVLNEYWYKERFIIPEMKREELRSCIEEPASSRVMYFESSSLVEELIDEVAQMPGALPLLSFTLSELYLKYLKSVRKGTRQDRVITQADYEQLGGVARSLTQRADYEYEALIQLDQAYQRTIRHVMLRMLALSGGELAHRRVPLSELEYPEPENTRVKEVIRRFTDARLLVEGQNVEGNPYVEPAHHALVRGWNKLLEWKQDQEETIILQRRLTPAAMEWKTQHKPKFLWNSHPQLNLLKQVLNSDDNWLNLVEAEFVRRSVAKKAKNRVVRVLVALGTSTFAAGFVIFWGISMLAQASGARESAQVNLEENQQLDALIDSLQAAKTLKHPLLQLFKPNPKLQKEVRGTLQEVAFQAKERNRQKGPKGKIRSALSPDGKVLVRIGGDRSIRLWNLQGKLLKQWEAQQGQLQRVSFSPNGKEFVTTGDGKKNDIRLWNLQGQLLQTFEGHQGLVNGISFSPDGKLLASGGKDDTVRLWNLQGKKLREFKANQSGVKSIQFSPDGKELVSAGGNGTIRLWDFQGEKKAEGIGHKGPVSQVKYSLDGQRLFSAGEDTNVRIWDLQGKTLQECQGHTGKVWSVNFSPDGQQFASVAGDGTIRVWNLQCQLLEKFVGHKGPVRSVNFTPDGERLTSTGDDGTFRVWDFQDRQLTNLKKHQGKIWGVAFSPTGVATPQGFGQQLVSAGDDGTIRWNLQNQQQMGHKIKQIPVNSVSFSPVNPATSQGFIQLIASAGKDSNIYLSDLNGKQLVKLEGHQGPVKSVSFSPNDQLLASAGEDSTVRLWNLKGKLLHTLNNHKGVVNSVSFSPNHPLLVSAGEDSTVRLWNLQGKLLHTLNNHLGAVNSVSFSPDAKLFASGGDDGSIRLWNFQGEQVEIFQLSGQNLRKRIVTSVTFSPDGKRIFSRDHNGNMQIWDLQGELLAEWETDQKIEEDSLNNLSVSQDGTLLATTGDDGSVKLWQIETLDQLITRVCKWVSDYLQNNPSVDRSDRHLCDDVTENNITKSPTSPISTTPSPAKSPISPISTSPSPTTSPLTAKKFLPSLQATLEDYYTRGSNRADIKYIQNSTQTIKDPNTSNFDKKNAYINRGVVYFRQKQYQKAIADYTKVIKDWNHNIKTDIAPTKSQLLNAYVNRGIAYSSLEKPKHQLAIEDYNKAIAIKPYYVDAYINRGIAYSGTGKHERAIRDYTKAISIAPQNADIYYAKAFTESLIEGKKQEAIKNYQKAAELYQQQGKPNYSENALKKVTELTASFPLNQ